MPAALSDPSNVRLHFAMVGGMWPAILLKDADGACRLASVRLPGGHDEGIGERRFDADLADIAADVGGAADPGAGTVVPTRRERQAPRCPLGLDALKYPAPT